MSIPNIYHFVFGCEQQTEAFLFTYYVAVYSCYIINKPEKIYFYYHYQPYGKWWDKLQDLKVLEFIKIDIPTHFGSKKIKKTAHKADKVRMDVLYEKGGIYLDIDTICVRPFTSLLDNVCVLGLEKSKNFNGLCNAIMLTQPKSKFFEIWLSNYESHFNPEGWGEACIRLPYALSHKYPELVTIQNENVFFEPSWEKTELIFEKDYDIPPELMALHLWETMSMKYIKKINDWEWAYENKHTLYGKLLLHLLEKI